MRSFLASGSNKALRRPLAAMAFNAEGSIGGRVTPGGNGGSSMSLIDDLLRPVREFVCFEVGVAVFDLGRFLNRSLQNEKNEMITLVLMVN